MHKHPPAPGPGSPGALRIESEVPVQQQSLELEGGNLGGGGTHDSPGLCLCCLW